nr:hypothetical protein CFP56_36340 [Quercus suber]
MVIDDEKTRKENVLYEDFARRSKDVVMCVRKEHHSTADESVSINRARMRITCTSLDSFPSPPLWHMMVKDRSILLPLTSRPPADSSRVPSCPD